MGLLLVQESSIGGIRSTMRGSAVTFGPGKTEAPGSVFSPEIIVFSLEVRRGPFVRLDLRDVLIVVQRWREALVSQSNDMPAHIQEIVSGHGPRGAPLESPHLAFIPMASIGHPRADGRLLGLAAALPEGMTGADRHAVLRVLARVGELRLGRLGVWGLMPAIWLPWNLRPEAWTAYPVGATHWATVTPIALDRHPKSKAPQAYRQEVAEVIAAGCVAVGLPRPREVIVTQASAHLGVPPAHAFPRLRRKDGTNRRHTHAILVFDQPVRGPVLVGAGRYRGYGACRPLEAT